MSSEQSKNAVAITLQNINKAIPLINELADEFYMGPGQGTWIKLQGLIEAFEAINGSTGVIEANKEGMEAYLNNAAGMKDELEGLLIALEKSDMVLAGDLLNYEMIPLLEAIRDAARDVLEDGEDKDVHFR